MKIKEIIGYLIISIIIIVSGVFVYKLITAPKQKVQECVKYQTYKIIKAIPLSNWFEGASVEYLIQFQDGTYDNVNNLAFANEEKCNRYIWK